MKPPLPVEKVSTVKELGVVLKVTFMSDTPVKTEVPLLERVMMVSWAVAVV